ATTGTYTYDTAGRLSTINRGSSAASRAYTYDNYGRTATEATKRPNGTTSESVTYAYDLDDLLTSKTTVGVTGAGLNTYTYDGLGRVTSWLSPAGTTTTYYTYDSLDRLAQRNTSSFGYNDLSNTPVLSPMAAGETKLLRDPLGALLASKTGTAAGTLALDDPLHGDVTGTVNPTTGDPSVTATFDPWGKPTSTGALPLGYQGGYTDPVTGLTNAHARWYSPGLGAFTSRDTLTLDPTPLAQTNRYLYAN